MPPKIELSWLKNLGGEIRLLDAEEVRDFFDFDFDSEFFWELLA
jgi:hypothetical protein